MYNRPSNNKLHSLFTQNIMLFKKLLLPAAATFACLCLLSGCKQNADFQQSVEVSGSVKAINDDAIKEMSQVGEIRRATDTATGEIQNPGSYSGESLTRATRMNTRGVKDYYTAYAGVYWQLNYIRKLILKGNLPSDFPAEVGKIRRALREDSVGLQHDGNFQLADEALAHLEKGIDHMLAAQTLKESSATIYSAPWIAGRQTMQSFIDEGRLGFGAKTVGDTSTLEVRSHSDDSEVSTKRITHPYRETTMLSSIQKRAIDVLLEYADSYHASPTELMKKEFAVAIRKTNKLRDQLWLMKRPENNDGDTTNSTVGNSPTHVNPGTSSSDVTQSGYDKNGTDLPPDFPKDDFTPRNMR